MKTIIIIGLFITNLAVAATKGSTYKGAHIREDSSALNGTSYSNIYNRMMNANAGSYQREAGSLWSGRCFTKTEPNTPIAAALLFRSYNHSGPIGSDSLQIGSVWQLNAHPEYYDYKRPYEVNASYVTPYYDRAKNSHYLYLTSGTKTALRRDRDYIYEAVLDQRDLTSAICYYFLKNY